MIIHRKLFLSNDSCLQTIHMVKLISNNDAVCHTLLKQLLSCEHIYHSLYLFYFTKHLSSIDFSIHLVFCNACLFIVLTFSFEFPFSSLISSKKFYYQNVSIVANYIMINSFFISTKCIEH
jgi:hypothetical protein